MSLLEFGACPLCKQDISPERKAIQPVVCNHCGHTISDKDKYAAENEIDKKSITIMVAFSIFAAAAYIQISNWDTSWLKIIPLGAKETIGMMNKADFEQKAQICLDLKKWDCTEAAYNHVAAQDPTLWPRAAHFEMQRAKYNEAAQSYYKFFQSGGQDLESSYNYAKALSQLGQVDDAIKYFDQVLQAKPDTLQVTVIQNYVKLLMDNKRYPQAKQLIDRVRKDGGESAGSFMESEYKMIQELNSTASRD
jgi:tetratricopeptide (TPR) repeat protein